MSTHPTELLAAFVDGTLAESARAALTQHVQACEQCRREVALARSARDALAGLPEVPVPAGLVEAIASKAKPPRGWNERASRVVWAAAAAAVVAIVAWVGVRATTNVSRPTSAAQEPAVAASAAPDDEPGAFDKDGDYDAGEVAALTVQSARQGNKLFAGGDEFASDGETSADSGAVPAEPAASPSPAPAAASRLQEAPQKNLSEQWRGVQYNTAKSQSCFEKVGAFDQGGQLQRVIDAKYNGVPAYLGVFFEPPLEGGAFDRAVTWVLAKKNCDVLDFSQHYFVQPSPVESPLPAQP